MTVVRKWWPETALRWTCTGVIWRQQQSTLLLFNYLSCGVQKFYTKAHFKIPQSGNTFLSAREEIFLLFWFLRLYVFILHTFSNSAKLFCAWWAAGFVSQPHTEKSLTAVRPVPLLSLLRTMEGEGNMGIGGKAEMFALRSLFPDGLLWRSGNIKTQRDTVRRIKT